MGRPKITVLLCTVRPDEGYIEHPEWSTIGKVVGDLGQQTFQDFELVIVDGVDGRRGTVRFGVQPYEIRYHSGPRDTYWTRHRKVAISAYRNTGLMHARGELVVNIDDCCELPPDYLETFWHVYKQYGICLAMLWPEQGDQRPEGRVGYDNIVHGFGSYPLELAIQLNGYDESYDGGQGLEDINWGMRLYHAGLKMGLQHIPGFKIHSQSAHDSRAIDIEDPIVKCCNTAHEKAMRNLNVTANTSWALGDLQELCSTPCFLLGGGGTCGAAWAGGRACAYLDKGWPQEVEHPLWEGFLGDKRNWPNFNLREMREKVR